MDYRTTKKDIGRAFTLWLKIVDGREATSHNDIGGYILDNNPTYGGINIQVITNASGGVSMITTARQKPAEFIKAVDFLYSSLLYKNSK